jgi:hypothetical protein
MNYLLISGSWCALHFVIFLIQRGTGLLRSERRIFLFHLTSFAGLIAAIAVLSSADLSIALMSAAALHGIYSLTFLEFWSIAEGGYTITLLRTLSVEQPIDSDSVIRILSAIGDRKRETRIDALTGLRLITIGEDRVVRLTTLGLMVARLLGALRWLSVHGATG